MQDKWMPRLTAACLAALGIALGRGSAATAQAAEAPRHIMAQGYYLHEPADRAWQVRIEGDVEPLAGIYLVLHDAEGGILLRHHLPHGTYTAGAPYRIDVAPDGRAGDYRLLLLGHQRAKLGLQMPLSDLPHEAYGRTYFATGHHDTPIYFKAPDGVTEMDVVGYKGNVQVYHDDRLIADAMKDGQQDGHDWGVSFPVTPGEVYRLACEAFYLRSKSGLMLVFDPARWFEPNPELDEVKWWRQIDPSGS